MKQKRKCMQINLHHWVQVGIQHTYTPTSEIFLWDVYNLQKTKADKK